MSYFGVWCAYILEHVRWQAFVRPFLHVWPLSLHCSMDGLRPLRSIQQHHGGGVVGSFPCCPHCRGDKGDQWWFLVSELGDELLTGAKLNSTGSLVVKAGVCAVPIGNHYAGYGSMVNAAQWEMSTSKAIYSHFWSTSHPGPMNKFFDQAGYALEKLQMDMHFHRTRSKAFGQFALQCRQCGMSLVISWPKDITPLEVTCVQQLLASFVHPQPYQSALLDWSWDKEETDRAKPLDAVAATAGIGPQSIEAN